MFRAFHKGLLSSLFAIGMTLSACGPAAQTPAFIESGLPINLDAWGVVYSHAGLLNLGTDVIPYDLNSPLFTDYAHKLRTIWMPEGLSANYTQTDILDFPVGTIISKTFYYPKAENEAPESIKVLKMDDTIYGLKNNSLDLNTVRLIETRILAHRKEGWVALPYVWNAEQTEAVLKRTGAIQPLELVDPQTKASTKFPYIVPNSNQCTGCHGTDSNTKDIHPIGPKARHLNKPYTYQDGPQNQLVKLQQLGYLQGLPAVDSIAKPAAWDDTTLGLTERARAYLDINCAHCHSPVGPADTSGLHFEPETEYGSALGVCKISVSAGAGTGGFLYDINPGNAKHSILSFRMTATNPGIMMPELGRSIIHTEGVALIDAWIDQLQGNCEN